MTSLSNYGSAVSLSSLVEDGLSAPNSPYNVNKRKKQLETPSNSTVPQESSPLLQTTLSPSSRPPPLTPTLLVTIVLVTVGWSFQFGYGTGVLNNSHYCITKSLESQTHTPYTLVQWGAVVSAYGLGGLVGSWLGPYGSASPHVGRKGILLLTNVLLLVPSCLLMIHTTSWKGHWISRLGVGMVAGVATTVVPMFLSEIAPLHCRGAISTTHQLAITIGIVVSQVFSTPSISWSFVSNNQKQNDIDNSDKNGVSDSWKSLFVLPMVCGLVPCILLPFCPESPSYLLCVRKDWKSARRAIVQFQSEQVADQVLEILQHEQEQKETDKDTIGSSTTLEGHKTLLMVESNEEKKESHDDDPESVTAPQSTPSSSSSSSFTTVSIPQLLFHERSLHKQLLVGIVVQLMMQFSGIDAVFYYSTLVFQGANVHNPELATSFLGIVNVIITIGALIVMDSAGRKTLLQYSWMGMSTSYVILTLSFVIKTFACQDDTGEMLRSVMDKVISRVCCP